MSDNVNRYIIEPVDFIDIMDVNTGRVLRTMGHRVRDLETQAVSPGLMLVDDAVKLVLHMDKVKDLI
ncbi:MAG: hypothetical protein ACREBC_25455 [Pyrinomonadaceae bacterium]